MVTGDSGPTAVPNISPILADSCGTPAAGWSSVDATMANFPNDPDASGALFNIGSSTVTYTATDVGGNTATCSFNILVEFSVTSTDLTLIANPNNLASCGEMGSFDVLAFNFDSIAGLQFSMEWLPTELQYVSISNLNTTLNLGLADFSTNQTAAGLLSFAWSSPTSSGSTVANGEVLFTLNFTVLGAGTLAFGDNPTASLAFGGNPPDLVPLVLVNAIVAVTDVEPPTITCPADITVQAPGTTAVPDIAPVSVADNCAAPLVGWSVVGATIGSHPDDPDASGDLFNLDTSTVTYTATDAGNNTATCSFNVTVEFANTTTDLTIIANSANVACGGAFSIDVTALNFETVAGIQLSINWDPALFQYTSLSNFNAVLAIGANDFSLVNVGTGSITFAWASSNLNGLSVSNGAVLFRLNFNLLGNTPSSINFSDDPTVRLAFDGGTFDEIPIVTVNGLVGVADNVPPSLTCPDNVSVDAPQGQLFAAVNGLEPTTLTDNCVGTPSLSYTQTGATTNIGTGNANGTYNAGVTTVVYTATDANDNMATCSFQVVVDAGTALILQVDTLDLGCQAPSQIKVCVSVENFTDVKFAHFWLNWDPAMLQFDTVDNDYPGLDLQPSMFFNFQDTAIGLLKFLGGSQSWPDIPNDSALFCLTFNVLNANGLSGLSFSGPIEAVNSGFQNVPVTTIDGVFNASIDNVPPNVACPPNVTVNATSGLCSATYVPPPPITSDDCGTIATIMFMPFGVTFFAGPPTTVTYKVTDSAGNTATCSFDVTVLENNPPTVVSCPADIVVGSGVNCSAIATWTGPVFEDVCSQTPLTVVSDYASGNMFTLDTTLVNYTATDLAGNSVTCSFNVVVRDMTSPTISCPPAQTVAPLDSCSAAAQFDPPAVMDNCDPTPGVFCTDTSGHIFPMGLTMVTCTVTDESGNTAKCTFTVSVLDGGLPIFTDGCPPNLTVSSADDICGANPLWLDPAVTDACDPSLEIGSIPSSGSFFSVHNSPHPVMYTATDNFGNTATCTFTVTVADTTAPTLTNCPPPFFIVLPDNDCDTLLTWTPPTVTDNCGFGGLLLISNVESGTLFFPGDTMVVYTATDSSGNTATCFFSIGIRDAVPPEILPPGCPTAPFVVNNASACGVVVPWTFPMATDNCTAQNELVYDSPYTPDSIFMVGTKTFTISVTDVSGNSTDCEITIEVNGAIPGLIDIPMNIVVTNCQTMVSWVPPMPVGFCPPVTIDSSHAWGIFPFDTTIVTYTATDLQGNMATATFLVIVTETMPPVFDCPMSPIVVNMGGEIVDGTDPDGFLLTADTTAGCNAVELTYNFPAAIDNCVTPTVTLLQGFPSGSVFTSGINQLIFMAEDSSGNQAQCLVAIRVDSLPGLAAVVDPNPGCLNDSLTITAANIPGAVYTWVGPITSATNVLTITSLNAQNTGQYIVTASVNGCSTPPDTAIVFLTVVPTAENDLDYTIDPGATMTFTSVFLNDNLFPSFDFHIIDTSEFPGLIMNVDDGTFTYTAPDEPRIASFTYKVCSKTCPTLCDEAVVTISINDSRCVFIPNIITPNGDETNDWFTIPCIETGQFRDNSLVVYNQWGDKVYEAAPYSNDPAEAWRGTLDGENGKDLPDGVYFYIFKSGPNAPPMKGFVEIFR